MEPQYTLDENKQPIKITTNSEPIVVEAILSELIMVRQVKAAQQAREDFLVNELAQTQQIPDLPIELISKIRELPEFAVDAKPVEITPVTTNETKI